MCHKCGNSGWIVAKSKARGTDYTFRCDVCFAASNRKLSQTITLWNDSMVKDFEVYFDIDQKPLLHSNFQPKTATMIKPKFDYQAKAANDDTHKPEPEQSGYSEEDLPW